MRLRENVESGGADQGWPRHWLVLLLETGGLGVSASCRCLEAKDVG